MARKAPNKRDSNGAIMIGSFADIVIAEPASPIMIRIIPMIKDTKFNVSLVSFFITYPPLDIL